MSSTQPSLLRILLLLTISATLGTVAAGWCINRHEARPSASPPMLLTEQQAAPTLP